jgi:hypothetical protein
LYLSCIIYRCFKERIAFIWSNCLSTRWEGKLVPADLRCRKRPRSTALLDDFEGYKAFAFAISLEQRR